MPTGIEFWFSFWLGWIIVEKFWWFWYSPRRIVSKLRLWYWTIRAQMAQPSWDPWGLSEDKASMYDRLNSFTIRMALISAGVMPTWIFIDEAGKEYGILVIGTGLVAAVIGTAWRIFEWQCSDQTIDEVVRVPLLKAGATTGMASLIGVPTLTTILVLITVVALGPAVALYLLKLCRAGWTLLRYRRSRKILRRIGKDILTHDIPGPITGFLLLEAVQWMNEQPNWPSAMSAVFAGLAGLFMAFPISNTTRKQVFGDWHWTELQFPIAAMLIPARNLLTETHELIKFGWIAMGAMVVTFLFAYKLPESKEERANRVELDILTNPYWTMRGAIKLIQRHRQDTLVDAELVTPAFAVIFGAVLWI